MYKTTPNIIKLIFYSIVYLISFHMHSVSTHIFHVGSSIFPLKISGTNSIGKFHVEKRIPAYKFHVGSPIPTRQIMLITVKTYGNFIYFKLNNIDLKLLARCKKYSSLSIPVKYSRLNTRIGPLTSDLTP